MSQTGHLCHQSCLLNNTYAMNRNNECLNPSQTLHGFLESICKATVYPFKESYLLHFMVWFCRARLQSFFLCLMALSCEATEHFLVSYGRTRLQTCFLHLMVWFCRVRLQTCFLSLMAWFCRTRLHNVLLYPMVWFCRTRLNSFLL